MTAAIDKSVIASLPEGDGDFRSRMDDERNAGSQEDELDPNIVAFAENDPDDPVNWSPFRKWVMVLTVSSMGMIGIFATTTIVPAAPQAIEEFQVHDALYTPLLVSIWELGEGVGPFFIGPLAERFGRLPIYHAGILLGLLCIVASALSTNISMLVGFRFLCGAFSPVPTLGSVIIGDLYRQEKRGGAIAIGVGLQLIGPFVAPVCGSFIASALGWRWTLWLNVIVIGTLGAIGLVTMRETYPVKILERKAARLRRETGNQDLRSKHHVQVSAATVFESMTRPMQVLFRSPTVAFTSVYTAVGYGLSYLILTSLTEIMETTYGWNQGIVGLAFLGRSIGNIIGMIVYGLTSDRYVTYKAKRSTDGKAKPEDRLLHMVFGSFMLPVGLLLYGWTLQFAVPWIVPLIGSAVTGFGFMLSLLPLENYLVDAFEIHSASAIAAGVILRAITGAAFPLCAPPLYEKLGLGWGNSVLALCSAIFIPPLLVLVRCGSIVPGRKIEQSTNNHRAETPRHRLN